MEENGQSRATAGRPESKVKKKDLPLSIDPVTFKMLETLAAYGRFGTTKQEIITFILRTWLWENEARLKTAITIAETPLGKSLPQED